jgi:hypothetical protein
MQFPESYFQGTWVKRDSNAPCGAVACLRGEAEICNAPNVKEGIKRLFHQERLGDMIDSGATLLGLNPEEADIMFDGSAYCWPDKYKLAYESADMAEDPKRRARAAVNYLTHVIRTGKVLE